MNLFYYSEVDKESHEDEINITRKNGYSFNLDLVMLTYPNEGNLAVVLSSNADKMNPVDYQFKINPSTGKKEPVKVTKFEIVSEPIVVYLSDPSDIKRFLDLTGGPKELIN
jgi:hypothetical protein